jgi:molybdate transport system permease protein
MEQIKENKTALAIVVTLSIAAIVIVFLSGIASASVNANDTRSGRKPAITVFAAAGSMHAINEITRHFHQKTGRQVNVNFASSSVLAKQICAGADFDIYLSANPKWMDYVQEKNLIAVESRQELMGDRLVLIAPAESTIDYSGLTVEEMLRQTNGPISMGDPSHVPCGMYAKQALTAMGYWEVISGRIIPTSNVRSTQQSVEIGECPLGLVYQAGAKMSDDVRIIHTFNASLHKPIRFTVAAAPNDSGADFLNFLRQSESKNIIVRSGFTLCDPVSVNVRSTDSFVSDSAGNEWQAFRISLKVAFACTLLVAVPGILLGTLLARKRFFGDSLVNAVVHLPLVVPPVVTGYLALVLLGKNSAVGGWLYETCGISFAFSWTGAVLVAAIMGFPLLVRSVKTAVEMIDQRYSYAANTLGAGPARTFFTITLPLAGPGVLAGLILAFTRCLGEFGATAMFAGNIPGKTQTLSLAIYNFTQIPGAESATMRLVGISILLSFVAMLGSEILARRMKSQLGATA